MCFSFPIQVGIVLNKYFSPPSQSIFTKTHPLWESKTLLSTAVAVTVVTSSVLVCFVVGHKDFAVLVVWVGRVQLSPPSSGRHCGFNDFRTANGRALQVLSQDACGLLRWFHQNMFVHPCVRKKAQPKINRRISYIRTNIQYLPAPRLTLLKH